MSQEDITKKLPLWARIRIAHDFANDDEKKKLETLAQNIIDKHPDIQKIQDPELKAYGPYICFSSSTCQIGCLSSCQEDCQHNFENPCKHICKNACESSCQTSCKISCQTSCESSCQTSCESSCQTSCESSCQDACQSASQDA